MKAKICDSCGAMWVDNDNCKVEIIPIKLMKKEVLWKFWEKVGKFHLCKDCYTELLTYITPKNKDNETDNHYC